METTRTPVFHRYTVIEKIGSGGMGTVYKARDEHLDRLVALKVLPPALQEDERSLERFKREARALAHLNHPRVAAVYDAQSGDGFPYLVMELVEGENLERCLRRRRVLGTEEVVRLGIDVGEALAHIHDHGIVHRDVKTSNIIMEPEKGAVLADFGIALEESLPSLSSGALGTPEYMSPEQAQGRRLDGRSDLYSLGVVLFECLAGRPPFRREGDSMASLMDLVQRVTTEPVLPLDVICPDVPRWLCTAIMRCLAKDPEERFASASDLVRALRDAPDEAADAPGDESGQADGRHDAQHAGDARQGEARDHTTRPGGAHHSRHGDDDHLEAPRYASKGRRKAGEDASSVERQEPTVLTHLEAVQAVACGPNGRLASGSNDGAVRIWDGRNGRLLHVLRRHHGSVSAIAFSRDGRFIASADRLGTMCIWDGGTGRLLREFDALSALVLTLAFSPDGRRLASGGADRAVRLWDVRTGKLADTIGRHQGYVLSAAFSGDGAKIVTSGSDGQVLVWDVGRRSLSVSMQAHGGWAMAADFSGDGRRIVSGGTDHRVCIWNASNGTLLEEIDAHPDAVMAAVFSPSGRFVASAGRDGVVTLWDARTGRSTGRLGAHEGAATAVAFSQDGRAAVSAGDDGTVRVWPIERRGFGPGLRVKHAARWTVLAALAMALLWGPLDVRELGSTWSQLAQSATGTDGRMSSGSDGQMSSGSDERMSTGSDGRMRTGSEGEDGGLDAASEARRAAEAGREVHSNGRMDRQTDVVKGSKSGTSASHRSDRDEKASSRPRAAGPPNGASAEPEVERPAARPKNFHPLYGGDALVAGVAGWTIEVGRLRSSRGAAWLVEQYRGLGYRAGVLAVKAGEHIDYVVGVGHFKSRSDAEAVRRRFRGQELPYDIRVERLEWDRMIAQR